MVVALGSGKGGVGKTTLALALAQRLCGRGKTVTLVDADLGGKNLSAWLAPLGVPTRTAIPAPSEEFVPETEGKLRVLSICDAPADGNDDGALALKLIRSVRRLGGTVGIIDLGPGTAPFTLDCFLASDLGILVTTAEPAAVRASFHFVEACLFHGLHRKAAGRPEAKKLLRFLRKRGGEWAPLRQLLGGFNRGRHCLSTLLESLLEELRVGIVVNCVRDSADRRVGQALRAMLLDHLGLHAELWGYVPFRPDLRFIMRNEKRAWEEMQIFDGCLDPVTEVVELAASGLRREWRPTVASETKSGNGHTLVCSTKCSCWNSCALRRGGYPCPIMPLGELKTLLTSLAE